MSVKKCYTLMGGNYDEVMRLMMSEARVVKYLTKFKQDTTMQQLTQALEHQEYEDAFRYAHTLKGVSMNLYFTNLAESSSKLTEALRVNNTDVASLYADVKRDYDIVMKAINELVSDSE